jgi:hypothetical protein
MLARLQDSVSCTRFVLRQLVVGKCPEVSRGASLFFFFFSSIIVSPASFFFPPLIFPAQSCGCKTLKSLRKPDSRVDDRAICFFNFLPSFFFPFVDRFIKVTDPLRDSLTDALLTSLCLSRSVSFFGSVLVCFV